MWNHHLRVSIPLLLLLLIYFIPGEGGEGDPYEEQVVIPQRFLSIFRASVPELTPLELGKDAQTLPLPLGASALPFKGPRRRRRRRRRKRGIPAPGPDSSLGPSPIVHKGNSRVSYFGPRQTSFSGPPPPQAQAQSKWDQNTLLEKALESAWIQYGPKSKVGVAYSPSTTSQVSPHQDHLSSAPSNINNIHLLPPHQQQHQLPAYFSPNFQPMESEWDHHVSKSPVPYRERDVLQPGIFNRMLSKYIDFEVNHHEVADAFRKITFAFFAGILILGWVSLGFYLGFFPLTWLAYITGSTSAHGKDLRRLEEGNSLADMADRIFLALDGNWLGRLKDKVQKDEKGRSWMRTHIQCCLSPNKQSEETGGSAECEVIKRERKLSTFQCLSQLIYKFEFNNEEPGLKKKGERSP